MNPYEALANAIIVQAARDFREADRLMNASGSPEGRRAEAKKKDRIASFFASEWFRTLTDADGMRILGMLRKEKEI